MAKSEEVIIEKEKKLVDKKDADLAIAELRAKLEEVKQKKSRAEIDLSIRAVELAASSGARNIVATAREILNFILETK